MSFLRNDEIKKQIIIYIILNIIAFLGAMFINIMCSLYVVLFCFIIEIATLYFTKKRYNDISELTYQIDKILHNNDCTNFDVNKEGELAVLNSEIYKMTVRLREQAESLIKEKKYLKDYMADISHQIRTPMTSIKIMLTRLSRQELTDKEQFELTKEINKLLSRMEWLITALLEVAQLESGIVELKKENISIAKVINKALEPLKIQAELKNVVIDLKIEGSANCKVDYYWQVEAISNILKNCIEHSENGGTIEVSSKENPIYTEIVIKDNGNGICEEDLPHLFERFYKGKNRSNESIGIGLYLTKMIINKQNGVVTARNRESKGAEFNIKFYNET
ncbi:MAG: HAMP domain-containing histidine kinase [Clostridia bacterium]|nr:HAMP domain-containing histidine kinase [Clostridia bacterium]